MSDKPKLTDLKDLKELAEAATPGPWHGGHGASLDAVNTAWRDQNNNMTPDNYVKGGWAKVVAHVGQRAWRNISQCGKDAAFIAAANPKTVLELIARVEAAEGDTRRFDWLDHVTSKTNERYGTTYGWRYDINHNRAALSDCHAPAVDIRTAIDQAMNGEGGGPRGYFSPRSPKAKIANELSDLRAALEQAKAREAELLGALEPFAKLAEFWLERASIHGLDDEDTCATEIEFGHLRNAITAMRGDDNG